MAPSNFLLNHYIASSFVILWDAPTLDCLFFRSATLAPGLFSTT